MSNLIEKIPANELAIIDSYRKTYAPNEHGRTITNWIPIENLLKHWEMAKSDHLIKLLGGNLTISKPITYEKSDTELYHQMGEMMDKYCRMGREGRNGYEFYNSFHNWICDRPAVSLGISANNWYGIRSLMNFGALVKNRYEGGNFDLPLEGGKRISFRYGAKALKLLGKIAETFNLNGFEDFRICHSQIVSTKKTEGEIHLSIHPMDYMTMSDNACDWDSCMSWINDGGYRQGTVEMMNSATVVVAYMESKTEDFEPYGGLKWNNKKWRQLYVVDRNAIVAVKDYPFHNDYLNKFVVNWLRDLAKENLGWQYDKPIYYDSEDCCYQNNTLIRLDLNTNRMYNDFGAMTQHLIALAPNASDIATFNRSYVDIEYSGASQCMACGEINPCLDHEGCLVCDDCQVIYRCDCCGDLIDGDEYNLDGLVMCRYCYDERVYHCEWCDEEYDIHNSDYKIHVIPRTTHEDHMKNAKEYINSWEFNYCRHTADEVYNDFLVIDDINNSYDMFFCSNLCFNKWKDEYLIDGATLQQINFIDRTEYAVYYEDLTLPAKMNLLATPKTNEEFKQWCHSSFKLLVRSIVPVGT